MRRNQTDWGAIILSLILLAILRFLYGKWGPQQIDLQDTEKPQKEALQQGITNKEEVNKQDRDEEDNEQEGKQEDNKEQDTPENVKNEDTNSDLPEWFVYLQSENFITEKTLEEFGGDAIVTRASAALYLNRYGQVAQLEKKSTPEKCVFPDIGEKSDLLKSAIKGTCEFDLLRGSNGQFIPDRNMDKSELLTVLVRTKTGFLDETPTPRFKNYFDFAKNNGLIGQSESIEGFSGTVTTKELGERIRKLSTGTNNEKILPTTIKLSINSKPYRNYSK